MALTRRQLLAGAGGAAAAHVVLPAVVRGGAAFGAQPSPHTRTRNRLVVIHLYGGNDGLNTVVPMAGARYDVYRKVRPSIGYAPSQVLPLDLPHDRPHHLGLNPRLKTVHRLYRLGRVAIVQGVDYPKHSYSHFTSSDIWHSGEPGRAGGSGWLGRHLDRAGAGDGELRGLAIGGQLPLMLRGRTHSGLHIASVGATRFADGGGAVADARHDAMALFDNHVPTEPLRRVAGHGARQAVDLVDTMAKVKPAPTTGDQLGDAMMTARTLLALDLGVECVFVSMGGFDNHTDQRSAHEAQLARLDDALRHFYYGSGGMPRSISERTTVMVISEFGRRIGETGAGPAAGTDHGAAAPVLLIGPRVAGGLHGEHPTLGTTKAPADNLEMTTDVRRVYRAVLDRWLRDPDPLYERIAPLPRLFR
ncbi:MAG TPA: DUF1501 domain-containing protein [Frankiaceae bacterium]|jgi:uncharacterized protein (DUF1501 family)|nr:DUF1501 domain-containing protein [Frankiaceae bacterium]